MAYVGRPAPQFQFDALVKNSFSGNGSTTDFTLTKSPASVNSLLVLVNNVVQEPATAFTLSDTTLTFTSAPPSGSNNIYACFWGGTLGITTAVKLDTSNVAAITGNVTPASNVAFSLGQPASAWKELWLDGNSLHLGNTSMSIGKTGEVEFMKTNKLGQPVTSVDVANVHASIDAGGVLSFYSANTTGNVRFARGAAIGYANSKVPGANLDVKGNASISGVTNAATFEPTGDTSSSDAAAIGYTAVEGLILTGQGSTGDVTIKNDADTTVAYVPTGTDDLRFPDNAKLELGSVGDLQIYHDASDSYIADGGTGALKIRASDLRIENANGSETFAVLAGNGAVTLYYDNTATLATASTGVDVTGQFDITKSAQAEVRTAGVIGGTGQTTLGTNAYQNTTPQFNFADAQNWSITLANNVSLANPLNAKVGQTGSVFVQQDGTGSRTMSFQKSWIWAADSAPTLTTTASANDRIDYIVQAVYANNMAQGIQAVATLDLK